MRRWILGLVAALLLLGISLSARAAEAPPFSVALTQTEGRTGESFDCTLSYDGSAGPLGAFVLWVEFDPDLFSCKSLRVGEGLRENYVTTSDLAEGQGALVYTQKSGDLAYKGPGDLLTCRFQVKDGAPDGTGVLRVRVGQVISPEGESLCPDWEGTLSYEVLEPVSSDASLLRLEPDLGELDQPFSSGQLTYTMSVPYNATSMTFTAEPAPGATCRVNRKKLEAGGRETEFQITVTAADGKTKQVYCVNVFREPREEASGDALLTTLTPDTGELEPAFAPERFHYTMSVPYETASIHFTAVPAEGAACKVNREKLDGAGSTTTFSVTVTAADGKTKEVYQIAVYRGEKDPALTDTALRSLVPDTGELEPPFSPEETEYTMTVPFSVKSLTFRTEAAEGASCSVNRKNLGAGGSDTEFRITVTAADKETKQTYRILVHREEQVKTTTTVTSSSSSSGNVKAAASPTVSPTKTPKPSASPKASPSPTPSGIPVPVEEEPEDGDRLPIEDTVELPESPKREESAGPALYGAFAGVGAGSVLLSGRICRWLEKRRNGKKGPKE